MCITDRVRNRIVPTEVNGLTWELVRKVLLSLASLTVLEMTRHTHGDALTVFS
jgi:hypothetical protein